MKWLHIFKAYKVTNPDWEFSWTAYLGGKTPYVLSGLPSTLELRDPKDFDSKDDIIRVLNLLLADKLKFVPIHPTDENAGQENEPQPQIRIRLNVSREP